MYIAENSFDYKNFCLISEDLIYLHKSIVFPSIIKITRIQLIDFYLTCNVHIIFKISDIIYFHNHSIQKIVLRKIVEGGIILLKNTILKIFHNIKRN